jgi:asparagine synthase (glutamine-hydrolysing)
MNVQTVPPLASVTGDFVLAGGPDARQWLLGLSGFRVHESAPGTTTLAVRGAVHRARCDDGRRHWAALADLIDGRLAEGAEHAHAQPPPQRHWRGRFAQLVWDERSSDVTAFTDHFASVPLYWFQSGEHYAFASDLRLLLGAPGCDREPNLQAVYHYLNFAFIPAPLTICRQIRRIEPGTRLRLRAGQARIERYYIPEYREDLRGADTLRAEELRERIVASVQDHRPLGDAGWGCFLSGGTDSSSIVSILARQRRGIRVKTCSIGFAEAGYDELGFAQLAAQACGADANFATVDRARTLDLLDTVVAAYDQPFGNASAIPTLACAELGSGLGLGCMLAGDGGDEIFGGNQRYAKDKVMDAFYRLPSPLKAAARGLGNVVGGGQVHFLNRVRNFTERASQPNPDRFYSDDSFASDHYDTLLSDDFRAAVTREASLKFMRGVYAQGGDASALHRIMRLDLQMAIAQNDLVKVHGACKQHGVTARFPYLDPMLVDYTGRLGPGDKLRGLNKRYLFKRAMQDILPQAILRKPKQGFGLPISVWIRSDPAMQSRVRDLLLDDRTRERGWIRPEFVARLVDLHMAGGWDYSAAIWQLLMLELWMRRYMDG